MPDIYVMDSAFANGIFVYFLGVAIVYGAVVAFVPRRKK